MRMLFIGPKKLGPMNSIRISPKALRGPAVS